MDLGCSKSWSRFYLFEPRSFGLLLFGTGWRSSLLPETVMCNGSKEIRDEGSGGEELR